MISCVPVSVCLRLSRVRFSVRGLGLVRARVRVRFRARETHGDLYAQGQTETDRQ